MFVSTHLISEFEGLIDEFTIIENGRQVLTLDADAARERYQKIYARFASEPAALDLPGARVLRHRGREFEVLVNGNAADVMARLQARSPESLTTESLTPRRDLRHDAAARRGGGGVIQKEFRALLPVWAAAGLAMLLAAATPDLRGFGVPAYLVGVAVLGAMAIGHEYSHHTTGLMLSLPASRQRVLVTKLACPGRHAGGADGRRVDDHRRGPVERPAQRRSLLAASAGGTLSSAPG